MTTYDRRLLETVERRIIGRRRELESTIAALAAGRHLLLEGPPGTGKSTVLREIAGATGAEFEFVEGNAELTPARLIGSFDPAGVLDAGYSPDVFIDGPLVSALRGGALLYVEEINRIPEETLNVLITVMSEGELHVPRLGRIVAEPGFRLVAAMNPFDAVGTARISSAVYDRVCRVSVQYQEASDEILIAARAGAATNAPPQVLSTVVACVRATRNHPDLRTGSSVRGAIDLLLVMGELALLRGTELLDPGVTLDACLLALSGRVRVRDGSGRSADEVVTELWREHFAPVADDADDAEGSSGGGDPGKA